MLQPSFQGVLGPTSALAETLLATFNPTASGRQSYGAVTSFASPTRTDNPGLASWVAGGPNAGLIAQGYKLQMRYLLDRFEGINGSLADHVYSLAIGGTDAHDAINTPSSSNFDTGWFDVSAALAGTIAFRDWLNNAAGIGGSAYVGNVTLYYRYSRI